MRAWSKERVFDYKVEYVARIQFRVGGYLSGLTTKNVLENVHPREAQRERNQDARARHRSQRTRTD